MRVGIESIQFSERPYKCDICETAFMNRAAMKAFKLIRSGEK